MRKLSPTQERVLAKMKPGVWYTMKELVCYNLEDMLFALVDMDLVRHRLTMEYGPGFNLEKVEKHWRLATKEVSDGM